MFNTIRVPIFLINYFIKFIKFNIKNNSIFETCTIYKISKLKFGSCLSSYKTKNDRKTVNLKIKPWTVFLDLLAFIFLAVRSCTAWRKVLLKTFCPNIIWFLIDYMTTTFNFWLKLQQETIINFGKDPQLPSILYDRQEKRILSSYLRFVVTGLQRTNQKRCGAIHSTRYICK